MYISEWTEISFHFTACPNMWPGSPLACLTVDIFFHSVKILSFKKMVIFLIFYPKCFMWNDCISEITLAVFLY